MSDDVQFYMSIFVSVTLMIAALFVMAAVWMRSAPRAALVKTDAAVAEVDARVTAVALRVTEIEANVRHLPTKDDVHTLEKAMLQLTATVERLGERMDGAVRGVDRIETYLMTPGATTPNPDRNHA